MKNPFRILLLALTFSAFAVSAYAGPGPQHWESQRRAAQFKQLKPGDKLNFVCMHCKTITEVPIESKDQAMSLCMQGSMVSSPDCNMKMKVVNKPSSSGDPSAAASEVIYVDDKGVECGFFVKANGKK